MTAPYPDPGGAPVARQPWGRRLAAAGVLVAVSVGSGVIGAVVAGGNSGRTVISPMSGSGSLGTADQPLAKIAAAVQPSVVSISVRAGTAYDTGSGVILSSDGTIVTDNHVVEAAATGAGTISVRFSDGSTASATILGRDPAAGLAVIRAVGVAGKTPAIFADSASVHVGDTVLEVGSPLGLDGPVSSGLVTSLSRSHSIQTDASINPADSGGALVDEQGRVIGINTAVAGFAIPVDEVSSMVAQLSKGVTPRASTPATG